MDIGLISLDLTLSYKNRTFGVNAFSSFYYLHLYVKSIENINCLIHGQTTAVAAVSSIGDSLLFL
jgi:hypothetical protein